MKLGLVRVADNRWNQSEISLRLMHKKLANIPNFVVFVAEKGTTLRKKNRRQEQKTPSRIVYKGVALGNAQLKLEDCRAHRKTTQSLHQFDGEHQG